MNNAHDKILILKEIDVVRILKDYGLILNSMTCPDCLIPMVLYNTKDIRFYLNLIWKCEIC